MASKKSKKSQVKRPPVQTGPCFYCSHKTEPDYLNEEDIKRFTTDRARIVGSAFSGLCTKHQKRLSIAIKRARHLALLPFSVSL